MAVDLFGFAKYVPEGGYRWTSDGETPPHWALTNGVPVGGMYRRRRYNPLATHPELFKTFADLPVGDSADELESVRRFASKYGDLDLKAVGVPVPDPKDPSRTLPAFGERHEDWAAEIFEMKRAVELWALVQDGDRDGLAGLITWKQDRGGWQYDGLPGYAANDTPAHARHGRWGYVHKALEQSQAASKRIVPMWQPTFRGQDRL